MTHQGEKIGEDKYTDRTKNMLPELRSLVNDYKKTRHHIMNIICFIRGHNITPTLFRDGSYGYHSQQCKRCKKMIK